MKNQKYKFTRSLLALFLSITVQAQSGGTFVIDKSVISGGGGNSAGSLFTIDSTLGQTFAGETSAGGTFSVGSGFWAAVAVPISISGTVIYGNGATNPFVSNVTITGAGSPGVMTTTAPPGGNAGQYVLTGFGAGAYTVTPTKTGGVNGAISSFDAGRIALHVAGPPNPQLDPTQLIVADVSGNGVVSSFDAGMIAKFVAGPPYTPPGIGSTATWRFSPVNRAYASVTSNVNGEDYTALLMGEVSGNWTNTVARPINSIQSAATGANVQAELATGSVEIFVELPKMVTSTYEEVTVPVRVQGAANKGVIAYECELRYDPSVILPLLDPVDITGTVSRSLTSVVNASERGVLRVVVYGSMPIDENGVLLNLTFAAVGAPGSVSPLTWERMMFNEGEPAVMVSDGRVELSN